MLHDGQAKARAAGLLGMAFIHPVEPLEYLFPVLRRDADARIRDLQQDGAGLFMHRYHHAALGPVVLNGIVAQIVHHLF